MSSRDLSASAEVDPGKAKPMGSAGAARLVLAILGPLVLLGLLIAVFGLTRGGLDLSAPTPIEELTVERVVLEPGVIKAQVRNTGPSELTLALVNVNDSTWPATASPSNVIPRLGTATVTLNYPWVAGEAYELAFVSANAIVFHASIPVAFETPQPTIATAASFALIGVYVGIVPIVLGMLWLPALRLAGRRTMLFLVALTTGVLAALGIETMAEAFEQAALVAGPFQGALLVGLGAVGAYAVLSAVSFRQNTADRDAPSSRWTVAYLIALGIGLHNLGEGLAIGAAYSVGAISLGAFLVIGFIIQNMTEGIAIVVPILRDRIRLTHLVALAAIAGAPAIIGTLVGAFTYSVAFATLFLAIGAGAILQVLYQVGQLALRDVRRMQAPLVGLAGLATGMLLLYVTGLLVK